MGQGAALGLSNSFMSLGRIVGPLWAGYAFDVNTDYPYLSGAAILFLGALLSLAWRMRIPEKTGGAQGQALKLG
jgi:DHA1 family multidrug resistance protein-like MFS transporter